MKHILIKIISIILLIISIIIAIIGIVKSSNIFTQTITDFTLTEENEKTWTSLPNQAKLQFSLNLFQYNPEKTDEILFLTDVVSANGKIKVKSNWRKEKEVNVDYKYIDLSVEEEQKGSQSKRFNHMNIESIQIWNYIKSRSKTDVSLQLFYSLMCDLMRNYLESKVVEEKVIADSLKKAFDVDVEVSKWKKEDYFLFNSLIISEEIRKYKQSLIEILNDTQKDNLDYDYNYDYEYVTFYKYKYEKTILSSLKNELKDKFQLQKSIVNYLKSSLDMENFYKSSNKTILFQVNSFESTIETEKLINFLNFDFEFQGQTAEDEENIEKSVFLKKNFEEISESDEGNAKEKIRKMLNDEKSEINVDEIYKYIKNISTKLDENKKMTQEETSSYYSISKFASEFFYEYSNMIGLADQVNQISEKIHSKLNDQEKCKVFLNSEEYKSIKQVKGYDISNSKEDIMNVILSIIYADRNKVNRLINEKVDYSVINSLYSSLLECINEVDSSFSVKQNYGKAGLKMIFLNEKDIDLNQVKIITFKNYFSMNGGKKEEEISEEDLNEKDSFEYLYSQGYIYKVLVNDSTEKIKFNTEIFRNYMKFLYKSLFLSNNQVSMSYIDIIKGYESSKIKRLSNFSYLIGGLKEISLYINPILSCFENRSSNLTLNSGQDEEEYLRNIVSMNGKEKVTKERKYYFGNNKYGVKHSYTSSEGNSNFSFSLKSNLTDGFQINFQTKGILDLSLLQILPLKEVKSSYTFQNKLKNLNRKIIDWDLIRSRLNDKDYSQILTMEESFDIPMIISQGSLKSNQPFNLKIKFQNNTDEKMLNSTEDSNFNYDANSEAMLNSQTTLIYSLLLRKDILRENDEVIPFAFLVSSLNYDDVSFYGLDQYYFRLFTIKILLFIGIGFILLFGFLVIYCFTIRRTLWDFENSVDDEAVVKEDDDSSNGNEIIVNDNNSDVKGMTSKKGTD